MGGTPRIKTVMGIWAAVLVIVTPLLSLAAYYGLPWQIASHIVVLIAGMALGSLLTIAFRLGEEETPEDSSPSPPPKPAPDPKPAAPPRAEPIPKPRPEPEPEPRREPELKPLPLPPRQEDRKKEPQAQPKPLPPETAKALRNMFRKREVCPKGPHTVKAGQNLPIELDVRDGDHVMGALREVSGSRLKFDFYICDLKEKLRFEGGTKPKALEWGYDEHTHPVDFKVPSTPVGPWYLILSVETKQLSRKIEAVLNWVDD